MVKCLKPQTDFKIVLLNGNKSYCEMANFAWYTWGFFDAFHKYVLGIKGTIGIKVKINETAKYDGRFGAYVL